MREGTKVRFFEGELEKMSAQNKKKLDEQMLKINHNSLVQEMAAMSNVSSGDFN